MRTNLKLRTKEYVGVCAIVLVMLSLYSCKKDKPIPADNPPDTGPVINPKDPSVATTVGFFLNDWKEKTFIMPMVESENLPNVSNPTDITVESSQVIAKVPPGIYGQNSVSFVSNISGHTETMKHIKNLNPTIIRFPGGSISNSYFFNRSYGDRPADAPTVMMGANGSETNYANNYWYGKNNPESRANLDDYYSLLSQTGAKGMITVNYSYARYGTSNKPVNQAAHLAADWVRHDNGRTKFWLIGQEHQGSWENGYRINTATNKDGQPEYLSGQLYAQHSKAFIDSMRKAASEIGKTIQIGVGLIEANLTPGEWLYQNSLAAREWNKGILTEMKTGTNTPDFYEVHNYYLNNDENSYGLVLNSAQIKTGAMTTFLNSEFLRYGSPAKPIALTEYNIFATGSAGSMQQVSFVNGMHTTVVLGEAIKNNFGAAVRWDFFNGWSGGADHGMFDLGDHTGGRKGNPRPVFYYMYYFQKMFGDRMLKSSSTKSTILSYASSFSSGQKSVVLVNKNTTEQPVRITFKNAEVPKKYYWYVLTGGTDNGDFSLKVLVNGVGPAGSEVGGPLNYDSIKAKAANANNGRLSIMLPPRSVVFAVAEK